MAQLPKGIRKHTSRDGFEARLTSRDPLSGSPRGSLHTPRRCLKLRKSSVKWKAGLAKRYCHWIHLFLWVSGLKSGAEKFYQTRTFQAQPEIFTKGFYTRTSSLQK